MENLSERWIAQYFTQSAYGIDCFNWQQVETLIPVPTDKPNETFDVWKRTAYQVLKINEKAAKEVEHQGGGLRDMVNDYLISNWVWIAHLEQIEHRWKIERNTMLFEQLKVFHEKQRNDINRITIRQVIF